MSIMEEDLRTYLIADATVGGLVGTRAYPRILPQKVVYPAIRFYIASVVENRELAGPGGKERARVTIDSWAQTELEAKQLAKAVKARVNGLQAVIGSTRVTSVHLDNEFDLDQPEAGEVNTSGVRGVHQDFIVAHTNV